MSIQNCDRETSLIWRWTKDWGKKDVVSSVTKRLSHGVVEHLANYRGHSP